MRISGSNLADLAIGATREVTPDDFQIDIKATVQPVVDLIQPITVSAAGSTETVQGSFLKANHVLALAPSQAQTITDFVTIVAGLWEINFMVAAWFDYTKVAADAKAFAIGFLPTDTGQTTQFLGMFAVAGTQNNNVTFRLLSRKGGTFRAVLGPTGVAQNISVSLSLIGNRLL